MDAISQAGQGQSYFVEDAESIPGALSSALGGLMSMSAQNVELTFTPKVSSSMRAAHLMSKHFVRDWLGAASSCQACCEL